MKNKIILILLSIAVCSFQPASKKPDCKSLRTGTFQIKMKDGSTHLIIRSKQGQVEKIVETGTLSQMKIKWVTECMYILYDRIVFTGSNPHSELNQDTLYNEILRIDGNQHTVASGFLRYTFNVESVLTKIK